MASFELFVDLLYVGIIAINGDTAAEHATGRSFLRFCITFILSWKIWTDFTLIISWFESGESAHSRCAVHSHPPVAHAYPSLTTPSLRLDDILQRISVLFGLACLFGYTTNVVESDHSTYKQMIAFFVR